MSFTAESRERTRPVLPLAAMVDVLFLLLIFFMTVSTFREQELHIPVNLAAAETAEPGTATGVSIVITITDDDRIYLGQRELALNELERELVRLAEQLPGDALAIRGDDGVDWGLGMRVVDLARKAGFTDLDLNVAGLTEP